MNVEEWLQGLGLAQYAAAFVENDIDFTLLGKLTDADLKDLGISSLGHRKRLLAAIAERGVTAAPSPRQPESHADGSLTGERRQVTILFADLCGFTAISRTLDPEDVRELLGRYTALVDGIALPSLAVFRFCLGLGRFFRQQPKPLRIERCVIHVTVSFKQQHLQQCRFEK